MTELLLVGAGHAHLHIVKNAAAMRAAGYSVHLLAPRYFHYSGLASAVAAGDVPVDDGRIDIATLAARAGVTFHEGLVASLDLGRGAARAADGTDLSYDVLSFNIGSVAAPPAGTMVDPEVLRVKPLSSLAGLRSRLVPPADAAGAKVTILGGGASGVELAAHLSVRPEVAQVHLLEAGPHVGAGLPTGARRAVQRLLAERGVQVRTRSPVTRLRKHVVWCVDGSELAHDVAVLATGLAAPPLVAELGIGDEAGVPVGRTLQHVTHEEIYAVGDCANFLPSPLPRIGVHGVRQGPVLLASLLARAAGKPLPVYRPQRRALSILDLGAGAGLAVRGRWWWQGRPALLLKRRIDQRWLRSYQHS